MAGPTRQSWTAAPYRLPLSKGYSPAVPDGSATRKHLRSALERAGFADPDAEARELIAAAAGDLDLLQCWATRRLEGEPLAWLTGSMTFVGNKVLVDPGVYVPRHQTELLALRAIDCLPPDGLAADLGTGSGAVAVALRRARPGARVVASDIDGRACSCARRNGVEVYEGDLGSPFPPELHGHFDVVVAVVPYVPTEEMIFLPRDVRRYEPLSALDGGGGGVEILRRVVGWGPVLLRVGGSLVLELGGHQDADLSPCLAEAGFTVVDRLVDEEGDLRAMEVALA